MNQERKDALDNKTATGVITGDDVRYLIDRNIELRAERDALLKTLGKIAAKAGILWDGTPHRRHASRRLINEILCLATHEECAAAALAPSGVKAQEGGKGNG